MLVLNLDVNLNFKKKKLDKGKGKRKEHEDEPETLDEEPIKYEPNIQSIQAALIKPLEFLIETINSFNQLEKDLVPLVNIE